MAPVHNPHKHAITKVPNEIGDEIITVLPKEKPENAVGRPTVPFRKVTDGIMYVLRTGCQWKMLPREYGSGSPAIGGFRNWLNWIFSKTCGLGC